MGMMFSKVLLSSFSSLYKIASIHYSRLVQILHHTIFVCSTVLHLMNSRPQFQMGEYKELDLSYRGLTDLSAVLLDLQKSRGLSRLNLAGNQLRGLPVDLSFLRELTHLDISENPIHSVKMVLEGLTSLSRLTDLKVHFLARTVEEFKSD